MILTPDLDYRLPLERMDAKLRSPGLHCSDIIYDLDQRIFNQRRDRTPIDPTLARRGFVFERLLSQAFAEEMESGDLLDQVEMVSPPPGPQVHFTLDGWWWRDPANIREYKSTRKSSAGTQSVEAFKSKFRTWDWQIQMYLKVVGALHCQLYVLWLGVQDGHGYVAGQEPVRKYDLCYTPDELQETWQMLMNHAETMRREGLGGR